MFGYLLFKLLLVSLNPDLVKDQDMRFLSCSSSHDKIVFKNSMDTLLICL